MVNSEEYALNCLNLMDEYIDAVNNKKIATGKYEKLAVKRHLNDLATGGERGLIFDEVSAFHFFRFFSYLKHSKGSLAGKQIYLESWQCFIFGMIFGWKKPNEKNKQVRRFKEVFLKVARKNGKTTMMAGLGLYGLAKDNEGGPEVYATATKRDQAKLLFLEARNMAKQSPELKNILEITKHQLVNDRNNGLFMPISSDSNTQDGLNPHFTLVDEVHAHKTAELYNVMKSAYGSRDQGLLVSITTEGTIRESINDQLHNYAIEVLEDRVDDDSFFCMIFSIDKKDDPLNPKNFRKANPNLGVSVSLEYLNDQAKKAQTIPSQRSNFLTKHVNVKVNASISWLDTDKWKQCEKVYDLEAMKECTRVMGGLDLASVSDITSLGLIGELPNGKWRVLSFNWLPEDTVMKREQQNRVPYSFWKEKGWLETTPGNVTDYSFIRYRINEIAPQINLEAIAFDDWNSTQLVNDLIDDGVNMISMRQGYKSISPAMKELERRYLGGYIEHNANPVLSWAMANVVATKDPAGNIKADKSKSQEKIDPALGLIMATGAMINIEVEETINIAIG